MNKYDGLFILEPVVKDEALKPVLDKIQDTIKNAGGRVNNMQKMDQRSFARGSAKLQSGYYVNFVFDAPATAVAELNAKFRLEPGLIRWQITTHKEESLPVRRHIEVTESSGPRERDY